MGSDPDWAYLPVPALCLILDKLLESIHLVWFGAVCKQWQSVSNDYKAKPQPCRKVFPMLMFQTEPESETKRSLYNVAQRQIYNVELSVLKSRGFCGSSHGWLATVDDEDMAVRLFNPFKSSIPPILLPPIKKNQSLDLVSKVILSADPILAADDYVVLVICLFASQLIFFKPGFKSWRQVDVQKGGLTDLIFYKGLVYVAYNVGKIVWFDVNNESDSPKVKKFAHWIAPDCYWPDRAYLAESSSGNLFYIQRIFYRKQDCHDLLDRQRKPGFKVYKLRLDNQSGEVVEGIEVESLDGDTLFVGDCSHSMSVSAANFPGCQQNSTYFAHEYNFHLDYNDPPVVRPPDVGVFNVENGSLEQLCPSDMLRTIWITPSF